MTAVLEVDQQRTRTRFWFPGRVAKVKENLTGDGFKGSGSPLSLGSPEDLTSFGPRDDESTTSFETTIVDHNVSALDKKTSERERPTFEKKRKYFLLLFVAETNWQIGRPNPDAFPPKSVFGKVWIKLAAFGRFFKSPQGIFALRHAILSLALWIPSVCPSTAWFYYEYKGLWALIMGQVSFVILDGTSIIYSPFGKIGLALYAGDQVGQ